MIRKNPERGSIILASLVVAVLVAVISMSFAAVVLQEYRLSVRSLKANAALNLAEAGVDIAMHDLKNKTVGSGWASATGSDGKTYYYKTVLSGQDMGSGNTGATTVVIDDLTSSNPVVTSQGRVTHGSDNLPPVTKQVKVTLQGASGGGVAGVYSKQTINMNGTNVVFDAYDSADGAYGAALPGGGVNILDQVTVAVLNQWASVNLNKNIVYGKVAFVGTSSQGAANNYSDRVGWQWDNGNGGALYGASTQGISYRANGKVTAIFDNSRVVPNITAPTIKIPEKPTSATASIITFSSVPQNSETVLGQAGATSPTVYEFKVSPNETNNNNLSLSGKTKLRIAGPVKLIVDGAVSISGNEAGIYIDAGASLEMFVKNNINITGQGVANSNWDARTFKLIPTGNSGQNISLGGNGDYRGMFLGPDFNANINGNGAWYGAILANSVSITGNGGFHYDIQCGDGGLGDEGYSVKQWVELTGIVGYTYVRDTRSVFN